MHVFFKKGYVQIVCIKLENGPKGQMAGIDQIVNVIDQIVNVIDQIVNVIDQIVKKPILTK